MHLIRSGRSARFRVPPEGKDNKPPRSSSASSADGSSGREVVFEFILMGSSVKASAIDMLSGIEVSVIGPATLAARAELQRIALLKLKQRLAKEEAKPPGSDKQSGGHSDGGIIV